MTATDRFYAQLDVVRELYAELFRAEECGDLRTVYAAAHAAAAAINRAIALLTPNASASGAGLVLKSYLAGCEQCVGRARARAATVAS